MTVERIENEMTGQELGDWWKFYCMEPFGPYIENRRIALLTAMVCNSAANRNPNSEPATVEDFMPSRGTEVPEENDMEQVVMILEALSTPARD